MLMKCTSADKYKALYAPRCNGGKGCEACLRKWESKQRALARRKVRVAK